MSYLTTNAVVLRSMKLGESDRLITFFSREAGLIKAVAKGAVKSKKRFGGVLLTGHHVSIQVFLKKKTTLHRLQGADLVESYDNLTKDPVLFSAGSHLLELTFGFAMIHESDQRQFTLLTSTLRALDNLGLEERLLRIFELRTLSYAGVAPNFDTCSDCQKPAGDKKSVCFSFQEGGIRCLRCEGDPDLVRIPPGTRKLLSQIILVEPKKLPQLVFKKMDLEISKRILPPFCEFTLGKKLRSLRLMVKMRKDLGA